MQTLGHRSLALGCVSIGLLATVAISVPEPGAGSGTAPYDFLDKIEGSFINLNLFPVRPIVAHPSGTGFLALNTHDSTVERFDAASSAPVEVWDVPWGPVAMEIWNDPVSILRCLKIRHFSTRNHHFQKQK